MLLDDGELNRGCEEDVVVDVDGGGAGGVHAPATLAGSANSQGMAGSLDRPCLLLSSVMENSSEEDVEKNVFEYSGERVLLLPAARHDRDRGATMCKRTDQGERSSASTRRAGRGWRRLRGLWRWLSHLSVRFRDPSSIRVFGVCVCHCVVWLYQKIEQW